ncbi:MAG: P-loop ATPase, Sll1717 family [Erythrobacter sp.]
MASKDQLLPTLRLLDLGSSVAEFDQQLETYFIETQPFRELVGGKKDIIAGDKGTGKTAIFKILHNRYTHIPELRGIVVLPAFNLKGSPIFQSLAEMDALDEAEYIKLWNAFFLSLIGNWVLKYNKFKPKSKLALLDEILRGLELRSDADGVQPIFQKVLDRVGRLFDWKSAEAEVSVSLSGIVIKPKVDLNNDAEKRKASVGVAASLRLLSECLKELGKTVWVAMDRLDEAFQGFPETEIPALRALLRTYLDMEEFDQIKLKLFVRRDLFARVVAGGFVNLTHVNSRKMEVIWDDEDLKTLLCRRIKGNKEFCERMEISGLGDSQIFERIFPKQVDQGERKPETWVWMMGRIQDSNGVKPPRNLIDLVTMARDAQLRKEDREPRVIGEADDVIEPDAFRRALTKLSETRVTDTLLAEAKHQAPLIERFRNGKAEHTRVTIAKLLGIEEADVEAELKPLIALGFVGESGGAYKIPMLYRAGLQITQGKAAD